MSAEAAARLGDEIAHGFGLAAMVAGALVGVAVGAAVVAATAATGGLAAVVIAGSVAGGGLAGGQIMSGVATIFNLPDPTTGALATGSPNVLTNARPAVRAALDSAGSCSGLPLNHLPLPMAVTVQEGSKTVLINGKPASRLKSKLMCGAHIKTGSPNVLIGGETAREGFVFDLEAWTKTGLQVLGIGALIGGGLFAAAAGVAAFGTFVGIGGAGYLGFEGIGRIGDALGPGYRDLLQGIAGMGLLAAGPKLARAQSARDAARARVTDPFAGEPPLPLGATAKTDNFQANRPGGLDLGNLTPADRAAARTLNRGGYSPDQQSQVLNSGRDFRVQPGKNGDSMYGFSSKGYAKGADSPYWMDEASFRGMQSRHLDPSTGRWNRMGVKNELALPCYNRADAIYRGTLDGDQPLVTSTIGRATETVHQVAPDGSTIRSFTRSMTGGGTQTAPRNGGVGGIGELGP